MLREDEIKNFPDWNSLITHPGYTEVIDHRETKLIKIIGPLNLPERHPCGLATCRQPHALGWVVVDEKERVTNLGSTCGPTHFPELGSLKRQFNEVDRLKRARDRLREWQHRQPEVMKRLADIENQPFGGAWLLKMIRAVERALPQKILSELRLRARRGERTVHEVRKRSKEQIADLVARGEKAERAQYEQLPAGEFTGLDAFSPSNDPTQIVGQQIKKPLLHIMTLNGAMSVVKLEAGIKAADEAEAAIPKLQKLISDGLAFATQANIDLLRHLAINQEDRKAVSLIWVQLDPPSLVRMR